MAGTVRSLALGRPLFGILLLSLLPLVTPSAAPLTGLRPALERITQSLEQARNYGSSNDSQQATTLGAVQQLTADAPAPAAGASNCPSVRRLMSAPGCPCTLYTKNSVSPYDGQQQRDADPSADGPPRPLLSDTISNKRNVCPAGYRCSASAAADMINAGWGPNAVVGASGLGNVSKLVASPGMFGMGTATTGLCVACQLGEYCPPGTQEETPLSLASCQLNPLSNPASALSSSSSSSSQGAGDAPASSCKGFKVCPAGSYCPDASELVPCEVGRFCPEGSITSEPCNISGLLVWDPFRTVKPDPQTLLETLVNTGQPLTGNVCPANTTNPLSGCPPGYYCPSAAEQFECPVAYYCPGHTTAPIPCPPLSNCQVRKLVNPDWSWLGLFFMLLLLLGLLTLLEYVRVAGRQQITQGAHQEEVMQLIGAVGFKMVCAGDHCKIQRVACVQPAKQAGFKRQLSATGEKEGPSTLESARNWVSSGLQNLKHRLAQRSRRSSAGGDGNLPKFAAAAAAAGGGTKDHTIVTIPQPNWQHVKEPAPAAAAAAAAVQEEYQINPRLTLCFRDVWVSDKPLDKSLAYKAMTAASKLCGGGRSNHSSSSSSSSSSSKTLDVTSLAEARLACAAARGAKFIVPGVSGKFVHSQLHAIMGPSGCGKTTVCKALAGRIPMSRVCGDIRVLCSTAADGFKSKTELAMAGSFSACALACNISHMTGFVPQFDLLHETLTVRENLFQAAFLRLPVTTRKYNYHYRLREVKAVVGEVTTLMALNKVVHQVVGSSAQRMISGGQRKRVAIGVELVAKPSLLWLDEPTSGLDAAVAYDVVAALKNSSQRGMNILAVMHQPRCTIFNMFDSCLLLSSNGHVVYAGPQKLALHYMAFVGFYKPAEENTADFLMDVIAGVVPRPGDPDYIPSQLATLWERCGDIWLHQQQQRQQQQHGHGSLLPAASLPPPPPATAAAAVDWPWRPRDLEALLSRFRLLVTDVSDASFSSAGSEGRGAGAVEGLPGFKESKGGSGGGSMLSYEGFLNFWDESGVKDVMGEDEFAEFLLGISDDFGMGPGKSISQQQFLEVLKSQLRAAAGVTAADEHIAEEETTEDEEPPSPTPAAAVAAAAEDEHHDQVAVVQSPDSVAARPPLSHSSSMKSPFQMYSMQNSASTPAAAAAAAADGGEEEGTDLAPETLAAMKEYKAAAIMLAGIAKDKPCAPGDAASEDIAAVAAAKAVVACTEAAAARGITVPNAACFEAASAAAAAAVGPGSVSEVTESVTGDQMSRASSSVLHGRRVCSPGMLTCPATRMQQRVLLRQQNTAPGAAAAAAADSTGQGLYPTISPSTSSNPQQQQQQQLSAQEAVARFRKARKALLKQRAKHQTAGQRQLAAVRQMRANAEETEADTAAKSCGCINEARGKCLNTLGDFMLLQHAQQQQSVDNEQQQKREVRGSIPGFSKFPGMQMSLEYVPEAEDDAVLSSDVNAVDKPSIKDSSISVPPAAAAADEHGLKLDPVPSSSGATAAAAGQAAAAAVMSRRLPTTYRQLRIMLKRCSRKIISCRHALMTDVLLTSVLGLALGVAQGRTTDPGSSLLWMLITLLAYGCMMLMRSTNSYGLERHLYLQLENQAGVSATAWVFGHQIFDIVGMLLHPALFYSWMYVLTLTPVPGWSYYIVLLVVGWYTTGLGYLVSLLAPPGGVMLAGLAVALILGGVANGIAPRLWQLEASHPILWLDALSYTRWGLQALYISWLTPPAPEKAPATAAFLSGLGFCGLEPSLMQALQNPGQGSDSGSGFNITNSASSGNLWDMTSAQRADALAAAAANNLHNTPQSTAAAAAAAMTQLWQYYNSPDLLTEQCHTEEYKAYIIPVGLGIICRLLVWVVVKWKTHNKASE